MNPKAKRFKINRCAVCGYKYSDNHHLYPRFDGGKQTIALCPNHHRYANMFQAIIHSSGLLGEKKAKEFAEKNFDKDFNRKVLNELIAGYYLGIPKEEDVVLPIDTVPVKGSKEALDFLMNKLEQRYARKRTARKKI